MAMTRSGSVRPRLTQNRRVMSIELRVRLFRHASPCGAQAPCRRWGKSQAPAARSRGAWGRYIRCGSSGAARVTGSSAMPHFGQAPGPGWRTSGCIGQVYSTVSLVSDSWGAACASPVHSIA